MFEGIGEREREVWKEEVRKELRDSCKEERQGRNILSTRTKTKGRR